MAHSNSKVDATTTTKEVTIQATTTTTSTETVSKGEIITSEAVVVAATRTGTIITVAITSQTCRTNSQVGIVAVGTTAEEDSMATTVGAITVATTTITTRTATTRIPSN